MECLSNDTLLALFEGRLSEERAKAIHAHIDDCDDCRALVGAAAHSAIEDAPVGDAADVNRPAFEQSTVYEGGRGKVEGTTAILPGEQIDNYDVIRMLGEGGMGQVFLAKDRTLNRRVALKLIHPSRVEAARAVDRFLFEARATARFNHPNIVAIHGAGEFRKRPYVALEFVEGQTLKERLAGRPLSMAEGLQIALAVADALREAHRRGILHRDLKPNNILIPDDGRVRVLDFGLAKAVAGDDAGLLLTGTQPNLEIDAIDSQHTQTAGALRGTPAYMAPEQWRREKVTPAVDVWALGLIMLELFSDYRRVKDLAQVGELIDGVLPDPPDVGTLLESYPPALVDLIRRCLASTARARPAASEVAEGLRGLLGSVTGTSPTPSVAATQSSGAAGRGTVVLWGAMAVAVAAAGLALFAVMRAPAERSEARGSATEGAMVMAPVRIEAREGAAKQADVVDAGGAGRVAEAEMEASVAIQPSPVGGTEVAERAGRRKAASARRRSAAGAARAAVGEGQLSVITVSRGKPVWANARLNGEAVGMTPVHRKVLGAGQYTVTLEREGYVRERRRVLVQAGNARLVVELKKQ